MFLKLHSIVVFTVITFHNVIKHFLSKLVMRSFKLVVLLLILLISLSYIFTIKMIQIHELMTYFPRFN